MPSIIQICLQAAGYYQVTRAGDYEQVGRWHFVQQIKETVETKLLDGLTYTYCKIFQQPLMSLELVL
jgi:hypothetical protein